MSHCIAELRAHRVETITLDIITRLFDNPAFACIHVASRFLKICQNYVGWEVEGFCFSLNGQQQHCEQNYERKCKRAEGTKALLDAFPQKFTAIDLLQKMLKGQRTQNDKRTEDTKALSDTFSQKFTTNDSLLKILKDQRT